MAEHFISIEDAESDLLACATYLAETIKSSDGLAEAMKAIVPRYLANGSVDLAAELANRVEDPFTRDKLLIQVAEKCAEIDDDEYAMQLAEAIEDLGLRSQAFERIGLQKAGKGEIAKALEVAESMTHPDFVLAAAAVKQAGMGDNAAAAETLERIEYPSARVAALQTMAMGAFSGGDKDGCIALLAQAVDSAGEIEHVEERIRTYCDIGNHYVEAGRNDLAIGSYEAARSDAESLDNIHRDTFLAASALGFLHAGSLDLADRTLDLITDKTQMASCLLAIAKHYWNNDEKADAQEALDEAYAILKSQREIETRDSRARLNLFASIAMQYAGFGKAERSVEIAEEIPDDGERTSALSQIAQILTIQQNDEAARRVTGNIADETSRVFALVGMSEAKRKLGKNEKAAQILDEAASLAGDLPQLNSQIAALAEIARRYIEHGESGKARAACELSLRTIGAVKDESIQASALAELSDLYLQGSMEFGEAENELIRAFLRRVDY